ncbi:MAG: DNA polymerase IV [Desulfobacteraceae bacterium]|nr:DNA polymerase IV [Desulfobacteraceae bacterium]
MTSPTIIHLDMDAFFASVEQLDRPELKGQCLVVGGAHRGVVAAASYEARKFGIHSAMPIFQAKQRCPHLVIVPPRHGRYAEISDQIMAILRTFSPLVEPISIDEAYVDITGCRRLHGATRELAQAMKDKIKSQTRLTCSVGIAPNKFLAKIASDFNKPDGLTEIRPDQVTAFIETLPVAKVPGVGAQAQKALAAMGIQTLGQVRQYSERQIVGRLGKFGHRLMELADGHDDSPVVPESEPKSMSSEITLDRDTRDRAQLVTHLLSQAESVARDLRRHQVRSRTITLKVRTADFKRHTRSQTLERPVQSADAIYKTAVELLNAFAMSQPVRLIGVAAGNLLSEDTPVQQELFEADEGRRNEHWEKVGRAMDVIARRYGGKTVVRGTLAEKKKNEKTVEKNKGRT